MREVELSGCMLELVKVDCGALAWQPWAVRARRVKCVVRLPLSTDDIFDHSVVYQKTFVSSCTNKLDLQRLSNTADQISTLRWGGNTRSIALQEAISTTSYRSILIQYPQSWLISKNKGCQRYQKPLLKDEQKAKRI